MALCNINRLQGKPPRPPHLEFVRRVSPNTRIVLVGVVPQWNPALPVYMVKKHIGLTAEKYAENAYLRNGRAMDKALKAVADRNGIAFFSVIDALCAGDKCLVTTTWDGKPTLTIWDNGHLTAGGSKLVASKLAQEMR